MAWRLEPEHGAESIQEFWAGLFPDPDRAVALDVAVAAHGAEARARLPYLPSQQMQVDDLLNVRDGVHMLGEPHSPARDRPRGFPEHLGCPHDVVVRDAARLDDVVPRGEPHGARVRLEAVGVCVQEHAVYDGRAAFLALEKRLADAL